MPAESCVVILAGGQGSRLRPYTTVLPKPLIPIGEVPILEVVVDQLRGHGFRRLVLAVNHHEALVRSYFGDGSALGVDIVYSREDRKLGTIAPLRLVRELLSDSFLVMNGDLLTDLDYRALLSAHDESTSLLTIGTVRREIRIGDGVIETRLDGSIADFREKPTLAFNVSMGVYAADRRVLDFIPADGAFGMDQLISALMASDRTVDTFAHRGQWYDIGRKQDLRRAARAFADHRARFLPAAAETPTRSIPLAQRRSKEQRWNSPAVAS